MRRTVLVLLALAAALSAAAIPSLARERESGGNRSGDDRSRHNGDDDSGRHATKSVRGTVDAVSKKRLVIRKANGDLVSGRLKSSTVIRCAASASIASGGGDDGPGDDHGSGGQGADDPSPTATPDATPEATPDATATPDSTPEPGDDNGSSCSRGDLDEGDAVKAKYRRHDGRNDFRRVTITG